MGIEIIIAVILCSLFLVISLFLCLGGRKQLKIAEEKMAKALTIEITRQDEQIQLNKEIERNKDELGKTRAELDNLSILKDNYMDKVKQVRESLEEETDNFKKRSAEAAENYFEVLEKSYDKKEAEIKLKKEQIQQDLETVLQELDKYKHMRAAAREALRKEQ